MPKCSTPTGKPIRRQQPRATRVARFQRRRRHARLQPFAPISVCRPLSCAGVPQGCGSAGEVLCDEPPDGVYLVGKVPPWFAFLRPRLRYPPWPNPFPLLLRAAPR